MVPCVAVHGSIYEMMNFLYFNSIMGLIFTWYFYKILEQSFLSLITMYLAKTR